MRVVQGSTTLLQDNVAWRCPELASLVEKRTTFIKLSTVHYLCELNVEKVVAAYSY